MKKTILALALSVITGTSFAAVKIDRVGYIGAELGGTAQIGDQDDDFIYSNMAKAGGDVTIRLSENFAVIGGGEARIKFSGSEFDDKAYVGGDSMYDVDRLTIGALTELGKTTLGQQCGIADDYAGFGDLSKEFGIGVNADEVACTEQMINHKFTGDNYAVGASYDFEFDSYAVGGSVNISNVQLAGTYTSATEVGHYDIKDAYTVGAIATFGDLQTAAKYAMAETTDHAGNVTDLTGYAISGAYALSEVLSLATSYNIVDTAETDDYFTAGASYQLNEHVELVTDYKFASDSDDKVFLRANVSF
ncbi:MAG: hypothetical protein ACI86X_002305 [Moritella sp.]|jgi:hypothetical protein